MRRVLILCEYPTLLGGERSMLATLPAIRAAEFDVQVAAPDGGDLADALRRADVPHVPWRVQDENGERFPLDRLRANIAAIVRDFRPHLLHANSLSMSRIVGPVATQCGLRSIGHLRDIFTLSNQAVDDVNANHRLVAVSNATRRFHEAQGIASEKCVVLYNGVDLEQLQPRWPTGCLHEELHLPAEAQLIATIGQLGLRKGIDVALARRYGSSPKIRISIGSSSASEPRIKPSRANLRGSFNRLGKRRH